MTNIRNFLTSSEARHQAWKALANKLVVNDPNAPPAKPDSFWDFVVLVLATIAGATLAALLLRGWSGWQSGLRTGLVMALGMGAVKLYRVWRRPKATITETP